MNIRMMGIIALGALAVAGCEKKADAGVDATAEGKAEVKHSDPKEVLLSVNGVNLTAGEIDGDVAKLIASQKDRIPEEQLDSARNYYRSQMAQTFLMKTLLLQAADEAGVVPTDDDRKEKEAEFVKGSANMPDAPKSVAEFAEKSPLGKDRALKEFEEGVKIDKFLKTKVFADVKVDKAEVEKIISNITSNNAEIVKKSEGAEAKINDLKKQLDAGADFAELAKANSDCPSSAKGGALGEFTHGQMVKEFDEAAFAAEVGKVVGPVKTQFGWHLILVTKKTPAVEAAGETPASPEKVEASHILVKVDQPQQVPAFEQVESYLKRGAESKAFREFVAKLREKADIKAPGFPELLPPPPAAAVAPVAPASAADDDDEKPAPAPKGESAKIESEPVEAK